MTLYLFDTNSVSDLVASHSGMIGQVARHLATGDSLGLCRVVHYEILRGLLWRAAVGKLRSYTRRVIPLFVWIELTDVDWEQAAQLWAITRRQGKQLGDPDLLLAAVAHRTDAILISSDADFDALAIPRENWRVLGE